MSYKKIHFLKKSQYYHNTHDLSLNGLFDLACREAFDPIIYVHGRKLEEIFSIFHSVLAGIYYEPCNLKLPLSKEKKNEPPENCC